MQHHEQAGAAGAGEVEQGLVQTGVEGAEHRLAAMAGGGRAWPVGGQLDLLGELRQRLVPVGELPGGGAGRVVGVAEQVALPQRVVGIADGQRREVWGAALAAGGVRGGQVPRERGEGPAVARDVVQQQQQHVLPLAQLEQHRPQRQITREVEAVPGRPGQCAGKLVLGGPAHLERRPGRLGPEHQLAGAAVLALGEDGAQRLVPLGQVGQCGGESASASRAPVRRSPTGML